MARIGFVGLGNMGLPMAQNLLKAGHQVEGVDVNAAAVAKLVAAGGAGVETAKTAAARADVVITMLPSGKEVREVYLGSSGIIENANAGTLLIDCSTIDVETAREVAAAAEARGLLMLDAPVSGGVGGAAAVLAVSTPAPPAATSLATAAALTSTPSTWWPALSRFCAIGRPMLPSPTNPMRAMAPSTCYICA